VVFCAGLVIYLAGVIAVGYGLGLHYFAVHQALRDVLVTVAAALALLGLVTLHYLLRRTIQAYSAARPGGIDIVVSPASELRGASANQISAELRHALADVYLSGPSVVPGESAPQDFLTDVRSVVEQSRTPWGAFLAALSLLSPRNVYRVTCTAWIDDGSGAHTLAVEISGHPRQDASVSTVSEENWPLAVRRAACHVAAYVLPRTRLSRVPPWTPWHGIKLNPDLFFHFYQARSLAQAGRLEEALYHFSEATALDPLNPYIRIEHATVQDELGLWVDALSAYVDVITLESWYDRPLWERYGKVFGDGRSDPPSRLARSPNGPAAVQIARFRMIASLAAGHRLARQWRNNTPAGSDGDHPEEQESQPIRREQAGRVISRLRPLLGRYAELMMTAHGVPHDEEDAPAPERRALRAGLNKNELESLRRVFQFTALEEARAMERDYRLYRRRRWNRLPISRASIRILPIWAALHYHYVERDQLRHRMRGQEYLQQPIPWLNAIDGEIGWKPEPDGTPGRNWPPDPDGLSRLVRGRLGISYPRRAVTPRNGWQEYYNAACTFALGMVTPFLTPIPPGDEDLFERHEALVRLAVDELSRAVVATDSQFASQKSVWLRRGDQDLDELRSTPQYTTFVERYLPDSTAGRLPSNPTLIVVSGHIARIVGDYAAMRAAFWQMPAGQAAIGAAKFGTEAEWWRLLRETCQDSRDWRTRLRLIQHAMTFSGQTGRTFDPALSLAEPWLGWEQDSRGEAPAEGDGRPPEDGPAGSGLSPGERHVNTWLKISEQVNRQSGNVVAARNKRLDDLGDWLQGQSSVDEVLREASRRGISAPGQDGLTVARQLAAAWGAIGPWVQGEPGPDDAHPQAEIGRLRMVMAELDRHRDLDGAGTRG